jgi:soluble lytic murein transglycosylase-like protein
MYLKFHPLRQGSLLQKGEIQVKIKPRFFISGLLIVLFALTMNPEAAFPKPFSTSRAFHTMRNYQSINEQANRLKAIETYFKRKNPKVPSKNISYYARLIEDCAAHYNIDPFLVASIMVKESTIKEKAVSRGNYGLMQINWRANRPWIVKTFPIKSTKELMTPANNVRVGAHILAANIKKCKGDVDKGLDRYRGRSLSSYRNSIHKHYEGISNIFTKLNSNT